MERMYHWVGFIVLWLVVLVVVGIILYKCLLWLYKNVYSKTWLCDFVTFLQLGYLYHNKLDKLSGAAIWGYDYQLRHVPAYQSHLFNKQRLALMKQMLDDSVRLKSEFDAENERGLKWATDELIEYGWKQMINGTWMNCDKDIVNCTTWEAWERQREWIRESKKKNK